MPAAYAFLREDGNEEGDSKIMVTAPAAVATFSATLNQLIRDLYEACTLVPIVEYRRWALREMQREIRCANAVWGIGSRATDRIHSLQGIGAAAPMVEAGRDDTTLHCWLKHSASQLTFESDAFAGLSSFITLGRGADEAPFAESERALLELLAPHLMAGWRHCQQFTLRAHSAASAAGVAAIVDAEGYVQSADGKFFATLRTAFAGIGADYLPAVLQQLAHRGGETVAGNIHWRAHKIGDLAYLSGQPVGALARLTAREQMIAAAILSGQSYAQSAATLGISINTLRNTVARVYRKLGVSSKIELAQREAKSPGLIKREVDARSASV